MTVHSNNFKMAFRVTDYIANIIQKSNSEVCFWSCVIPLKVPTENILAVRKKGNLNIKTKMFDFEVRVLIGWLANTLDSQPIRTRTSKSNIFVFMLRWPIFLTASIVLSLYILDKHFTILAPEI